MRISRCHEAVAFWLGIVLFQVLFAVAASAGSLQLVSATAPGLGPPAGGGGDSTSAILSRDGRFVLFASTANNLVSLGTNGPLPVVIPAPINVFLRDRVKGTTVLVSANLDGSGGGDADSLPVGVSTNGRYALFESGATNLVPGDTNNATDVFVRDMLTASTVLVSANTNGTPGNGASYRSSMSPDGRYVAFASDADDLVAGDTNTIPDVFVRDLTSKGTTLVSVGALPSASSYFSTGSTAPALTPDGRYVAFYSSANNLAPGVQTEGDLYLRDTVAGTTTWVSSGAQAALRTLGPVTNSESFNFALSDDGRFIAFEAAGYPGDQPAVILRYDVLTGLTQLIETNAAITSGGTYDSIQDLAMTHDGRFVSYVANARDSSGNTTAIRVWDAQSGVSILASGDPAGSVLNGSLSDAPAISEDGRFVAFVSGASNLVTNPIPGDFHLYLRDLQAGTTTLVDADTNGAGSALDPALSPALSADGRVIAFDCLDGRLVPADRNRAYDVFLRDFTSPGVELISLHDPSLPSFTPDGPSAFSSSGLSFDGKLLAFWSEADDLVLDDANGVRDVFIRDLASGTNLLVSVNTNGVSGDGISTDASLSAGGRYLAFTSSADDLVFGDANRAQDVFVRDLLANKTILASFNAAGTGSANNDSFSPTISSNGQFVLFHSTASNLAPGILFSGTENIFWRDLQQGQTHALTTNGVTSPAMTPDGSVVAYITSSSRVILALDLLYVWDSRSNAIVYSISGHGFASVAISSDAQRLAYVTNSGLSRMVFVADRLINTNFLIGSYQGPTLSPPRFSPGNRFLVYVGATAVSPSITQVYLFDFLSGSNLLVSQSYDGVSAGNDSSDSVEISADARFIAYRSAATNLVPGDTNGLPNIYLFDRVSGSTTLVSASRFGSASADNRSLTPAFSGDGRKLAFVSWASNLLTNDFNNNADIFALNLYTGGAPQDLTVTTVTTAPFGTLNWLTWPAAIGKSYRVQFKNKLNDPLWQELNAQVSVVGNRAYVHDAAQTSVSRFYRVVAY